MTGMRGYYSNLRAKGRLFHFIKEPNRREIHFEMHGDPCSIDVSVIFQKSIDYDE